MPACQQGRLDEAIGRLEEALLLKPDLSDAHNNMGIIVAMKGDKVRAMVHLSNEARAAHDGILRAIK